jgi:hypothetical protein
MCTSPFSPALTRHGQRWFVAALLLLFLALSVKYSFKAVQNRGAFSRWQPQVLDLDKGIDITRQHNYPNPPVMAVLLEPLAHLPPVTAALVWFYVKVALALLALHWAFRLVESADRPFPPLAKALAVLLSLKPIVDDLNHGNVNLFILFLVVAALTAYRRGRNGLAGVVLGLAIACKITPALFVPYFLWKRSWRVLAGVAVGLALFLWPGVVPSLRLGFEDNQRQLGSWYRLMVHPFVLEGKVTSEHNNQSLPGLVARLATHQPSFSTWVDNVYTPTRYDNLAELGPAQAGWLVKGCLAGFALLIVWSCRTPAGRREGWRLPAEFSLVVLGMLLFSERTWKHHAVTLVLPFAVLCYYLGACRPGRARRAYLLISLGLAAGLTLVTGLGPAKDGAAASLGKQAQLYGAYVWAYLVLLAALVVLLRGPGAPAPAAEVAERGARAA